MSNSTITRIALDYCPKCHSENRTCRTQTGDHVCLDCGHAEGICGTYVTGNHFDTALSISEPGKPEQYLGLCQRFDDAHHQIIRYRRQFFLQTTSCEGDEVTTRPLAPGTKVQIEHQFDGVSPWLSLAQVAINRIKARR